MRSIPLFFWRFFETRRTEKFSGRGLTSRTFVSIIILLLLGSHGGSMSVIFKHQITMKNCENVALGVLAWMCCVCVLADASSQSEPLLKQAKEYFQSPTKYKEGGTVLEQYIREQRSKFPEGYTFGSDAAKVAQENLSPQQAAEVIEALVLRFDSAEDKPIREGLRASLLQTYTEDKRWTDAMETVGKLYDTEKTNFVVNVSVLSFNNNLIVNGKTNEAKEVLSTYFCGTNLMMDGVMPNGFWMEQAATLAFQLGEKETGFRLLDSIEKEFPESCKDNQIRHILLRINELRKSNENDKIAKWVALAYKLKQNGYTVSDIDKDSYENNLRAYRATGWLDENNKANEKQVYTPPEKKLGVKIFKYVIIAFFVIPLLVFMILHFKKYR